MTTDEIRDELARLKGWEFDGNGSKYRWWKPDMLLLPSGKPSGLMGRTWSVHPYPPTLDGANAAVPEGYLWGRVWEKPAKGLQVRKWIARAWTYCADVEVPDTGDPVHDLYALALACVRAEEATQ